MNNGIFLLFGASGDLAKRKLIPALYELARADALKGTHIVGVARDETSSDTIMQAAREFIPHIDDQLFAQFKKQFTYQRLDFQSLDDFKKLVVVVESIEKNNHLSGNRLLFIAAASDFYCVITQNAARSGLIQKLDKETSFWHRIIFEKPFGKDESSAQNINTCIADFFPEQQIYRIDHYLTKEIVSNIALVRFTNLVFEPLWNNRFISNVQIIMDESIGIEARGAYYDQYGALRDVVQNHMLEMVALIAMESPEWLHGEYIRTQRLRVLEKIKITDALFGQYQGYRQEKNVDPTSMTETFVAARLMIDNERWAGVPFYLKTGKYLAKKETVIHIKFKHVDCLLAKHCPSESNVLTIRIAPEAVFSLKLNAKKPGVSDEVMPINMQFCHSCIFGIQPAEAYQVIIQEVCKGEQAISVRFDEIEAAWRVIDACKARDFPLFDYARGSHGPQELEDFQKKHGFRWLS